MTQTLINTRFKKIDVHTGPGFSLDKGGKMNIEVSAGLSPIQNNSRRVAAKVSIVVVGIPQKATDDSQYAFKGEVVVVGVYEWAESAPSKLQDDVLATELCQPLYVLAANELTTLVPRTGAGTISLPWTLEGGGDIPSPLKDAPKKPPVRRPRKTTSKN